MRVNVMPFFTLIGENFTTFHPLKKGAECSVKVALKRSVQRLVLVFMA